MGVECICGSWIMDGFYRKGCPRHDPEVGGEPEPDAIDNDGWID